MHDLDPERPLKALVDRPCVGSTSDGRGQTFHFEGGRRLLITPTGELFVEVDMKEAR